MNLTISGHGVEVTQPMREHVESKLQVALARCDKAITAEVIFSCAKQNGRDKKRERKTAVRRHKVEINLHVKGCDQHPKGHDFHIEHVNGDMYSATNEAVNKLDRALIAYKEKHSRNRALAAQRLPLDDRGLLAAGARMTSRRMATGGMTSHMRA